MTACPFLDPLCPCQDGDACHYRAAKKTLAMPVPPERLLAVLVALLLAAGCTTTTIDTSCTSFGPITYSASRDTPDTVLQVRRHNAAWDAICR